MLSGAFLWRAAAAASGRLDDLVGQFVPVVGSMGEMFGEQAPRPGDGVFPR